MLWLIVFGAVHGLVLWYGDILWTYGLCGLLIYLFRRCSNVTLIVLGLVVVGIGSLIAVFWQATMPYWPPEAVVEVG